jgi:hypothetical protein
MNESLVLLTDRRLKFTSGVVRFDVTFTVTEVSTARDYCVSLREVILTLTKAIVLINPGS